MIGGSWDCPNEASGLEYAVSRRVNVNLGG